MKKLVILVSLVFVLCCVNSYACFLNTPERNKNYGSSCLMVKKVFYINDFIYTLGANSVYNFNDECKICRIGKETGQLLSSITIPAVYRSEDGSIYLDCITFMDSFLYVTGFEKIKIDPTTYVYKVIKIKIDVYLNQVISKSMSDINLPEHAFYRTTHMDSITGKIVAGFQDEDNDKATGYLLNSNMSTQGVIVYYDPDYIFQDIKIDKTTQNIYMVITGLVNDKRTMMLKKINPEGSILLEVNQLYEKSVSRIKLYANDGVILTLGEVFLNENNNKILVNAYDSYFNSKQFYSINLGDNFCYSKNIDYLNGIIYVSDCVSDLDCENTYIELRAYSYDIPRLLRTYTFDHNYLGTDTFCPFCIYDRNDVSLENINYLINQARLGLFKTKVLDGIPTVNFYDFWIPEEVTRNISFPSGWSIKALPVENYDTKASHFGSHIIFFDEEYNRVLPDEYMYPYKGYWAYCDLSQEFLFEFPEAATFDITGREILYSIYYGSIDWAIEGFGTYPGWVINLYGNTVYLNGCNPAYGCYYSLHGGLTVMTDGYWVPPTNNVYVFSADQTED